MRGHSWHHTAALKRISRTITTRIKANFLLPDRIAEYERLLACLADNGFASLTIRDVARLLQTKQQLPPRFVVLKHDIDTDPSYAEKWIAAERKFGVRATYYFRLRTLNLATMARIEAAGGEASYHFEELATVLKRRAVPLGAIPVEIAREAQAEFEENFLMLQRLCSWKLQTVASHGDFMNRKFDIANSVILDDMRLREKLGILAEAYDAQIVDCFEMRFIDEMGQRKWRNNVVPDPEAAVRHGVQSMQVLTHPRQWRSHVAENLREDADRAISTILYRTRIPAGNFVDRANRNHRLALMKGQLS